MARLAFLGLLLIAVLAAHAIADDDTTDEAEAVVDEPEAEADKVACALEWTAEEVAAWFVGYSEHADKETLGAIFTEQAMSGKELDGVLADADAADEALTTMGFEDADVRSGLLTNWATKKDETCEIEEVLDPKYSLPPLTLGSSLACSGCEEVVNAVWDEVMVVKPSVEERSLKERRDAAHKIVDEVCSKLVSVEVAGERFEEKFVVHKPVKKSKVDKKKKKKKKKKDDDEAEEAEAEAEAEEEEEAEDEVETLDMAEAAEDAEEEARKLQELLDKGDAEATAQLQEACVLMIANHGLKLKSKLSGFYKETTKDGIRKKMCFQWQDLCYPAPKPKLKKREKCLIKAYKAIANKDWEMAAKYTACAKKALKVKRKKSKKDDAPPEGEDNIEVEVVEPEVSEEPAVEDDADDDVM